MHSEDCIHRIGRTGRAWAIGQACTLVTPDGTRIIHRIEYILKQKIEQHKVDGLDYSAPLTHTKCREESLCSVAFQYLRSWVIAAIIFLTETGII